MLSCLYLLSGNSWRNYWVCRMNNRLPGGMSLAALVSMKHKGPQLHSSLFSFTCFWIWENCRHLLWRDHRNHHATTLMSSNEFCDGDFRVGYGLGSRLIWQSWAKKQTLSVSSLRLWVLPVLFFLGLPNRHLTPRVCVILTNFSYFLVYFIRSSNEQFNQHP